MFISFLRRLLGDRVFTAHDIPSDTELPCPYRHLRLMGIKIFDGRIEELRRTYEEPNPDNHQSSQI
ncbi:hypothetical protein QUA42_13070 [Microcoleus sp. Pol11C2]|uniref:hypothetical protein n=1 Tax=Microcoleus sp. Pol11C2 TaxID=3055389 RepID=UPI002FD73B74